MKRYAIARQTALAGLVLVALTAGTSCVRTDEHRDRFASDTEAANAGPVTGPSTQPASRPATTGPAPRPAPQEKAAFFNGKDLTGWKGNMKYWKVEEAAIVGHSDRRIPRNEFLWSGVKVADFYLSVRVKLETDSRNAGIQFRSKKVDQHGQARGYQADIGRGVWGRLFHEHGRGKLDWTDRGEKAVKPGQWNRYEILAIGPYIWTAVNGRLSVAYYDPKGERSGYIALLIHSAQPHTVRYKIEKLVHNPEVRLAGLKRKELIAALRPQPPKP